MELAAFVWAVGDLPVAMAQVGQLVLGPQPWLLLSFPPLQVFVGSTAPYLGLRLHLWSGPWFLWLDLPPPRIALARCLGPALVAIVGDPVNFYFAWEIFGTPRFTLFGTLGGENVLGLRWRARKIWFSGLIRKGGLSLWCGLYF